MEWKSFLKAILILIVVDSVLLSGFVIWINATPDVSIAELLIILILIFLSLIAAVFAWFVLKNSFLTKVFLANSIISGIVFHIIFGLWFDYYDHKNFQSYYFNMNNKSYELLLDKRDTSYSFAELFSGSSVEFKRGGYIVKKDTVILVDSTHNMVLNNYQLKDYSDSARMITLRNTR